MDAPLTLEALEARCAQLDAMVRRVAGLARERDGLLDVLAESVRENTDLRRQLANLITPEPR